MTHDPAHGLERALELFTALVREDPGLAAEFEASICVFFCGPAPHADPATTLLHARRHLEWFLIERHSPSLFGAPIERLAERWRPRAEAAGVDPEVLRSLQQSFTGAFEVTDPSGDGAWLHDLAGLGDYPMLAPAVALEPGDLLVGRLYPGLEGLHRVSPAAGVFRGAALRTALERDLARTREGAGRKVLRLSQLELERLFWGAGRVPVAEDPVADARAFLRAEGLTPRQVERLFARLARHPHGARRRLPGAGDVLGELLDELAFETGVDLDRAREKLALAWPLLCAPPARARAARAESATEAERRAALAAFDAGRSAGRDLDQLFRDLERDLRLAPAEEPDPDELEPAPDFPGVVGAMIDEFRWEVELTEGEEAARRHDALAPLGEYAARLGRFDELDRTELLRFTTFWLPERAELDGERARALLASLGAFCHWAEDNHELPLAREFAPTLDGLRESLPRILEINRCLPAAPQGETGDLYEVRADGAGRFAGVRDRSGREHGVAPEPALADRLRPGDRLRGTITLEGALAVFRCYPPEAAGLSA